MNYTSIEQSKKLLELGLSPESADMYWAYTDKQNYVGLGNPPCDVTFGSPDEKAEIIPCWSVGALLEVIPQYHIHAPYPGEDNYICWSTHSDLIDMEFAGKSLIEASYNMVVWLLENNYIKND